MMFARIYSCTSPVGSIIWGHEGANIKWNIVSHSVLSVNMPEWLWGNKIYLNPNSLRNDLKYLFYILGFGCLLSSITQSSLQEVPYKSPMSLAISLLICILSLDEKWPKKHIEAANKMQSPLKYSSRKPILSSLSLTFYPYY